MNAQEIIDYIANSEKKTPVKVYVNTTAPVDFGSAKVFGEGRSHVVFGDWAELAPILERKVNSRILRRNILPVRVLPSCSGTDSEVLAAADVAFGRFLVV